MSKNSTGAPSFQRQLFVGSRRLPMVEAQVWKETDRSAAALAASALVEEAATDQAV
jgi:hypothetical protein